MDFCGLKVRRVLQQSVQEVDAFPYAAGNELAEERNIGVGNMVIRDAAVTTVPNVARRNEVLFV